MNTKEYASVGSWSPDGKAIAYTEVHNRSDVFLVRLDGGRTRLTKDGLSSDPSWSPDGRWIAYFRDTPAAGLQQHVYVMSPDGSGQRALVKGGDSSDLSWSPDSRRLAYAYSLVLDDQAIATVEVASGQVRQLTPKSETSVWKSPSWSPDGSMLVVTRYGSRPLDEVWVMSRTGAAKKRIVNGGDSASLAAPPPLASFQPAPLQAPGPSILSLAAISGSSPSTFSMNRSASSAIHSARRSIARRKRTWARGWAVTNTCSHASSA